ncbi:MAG: tRNA (adenosine(37)-N6)-threonylcarbamoyltransferase complex ATPase subunit type 1 TsaE [bacterium]|nr:tRNA (adenosine(37)-N6)-threonylcarbamoyltransferase complex ATPase subunit type 1 TsaE [bacterium]
MRYQTKSPRETQQIAGRLAKKIARQKPGKEAVVVGLIGDLGAGKTTFVQGFARALGIRRRMVSPTFTIMRRYRIPRRRIKKRAPGSYYQLPISYYQHLVHVDAYRVHKPSELKVIKFESWLRDPAAIVLVEWADLIEKKYLHRARIVRFRHQKEGLREVVVRGF